MKPRLVIGLGNPFDAQDSIGVHVAHQLAGDPRFQEDVEFIRGGTDLLRLAPQLRDRQLIILVDAAASTLPPGQVIVREHGAADLCDRQFGAHHLSAVQALDLLRWADESVARAHCIWVLVTVAQLSSA